MDYGRLLRAKHAPTSLRRWFRLSAGCQVNRKTFGLETDAAQERTVVEANQQQRRSSPLHEIHGATEALSHLDSVGVCGAQHGLAEG